MFGLSGTLISMVIFSGLILWFNNMFYSDNDENKFLVTECLLMASVLCATDTVAALAIVKESEYPTLNSILFGEGVINDGVAILLFKAVEKVISSAGPDAGNKFTITSD